MRHEARQVPSWLIFDVRQKMKPRKLLRPWLLVSAVILLGISTYVLTNKTSYERFLEIKKGDEFAVVLKRLGPPIASHEVPGAVDYLFSVTGHPDYPR